MGGPEDDVEEGLVAAAVTAEARGRARGEVGEDGGTIKVEIDDHGLPRSRLDPERRLAELFALVEVGLSRGL